MLRCCHWGRCAAFAGQARSHRYFSGFETVEYLWERACPANEGVALAAFFSSPFELGFEQLVHLPRVGLALRRLHRLADEEAEHPAALGLVGRAVLFDPFNK